MALSYPLAWPSSRNLARIAFTQVTFVGASASPFNGAGQTYGWEGAGLLRAQCSLPPMKRAYAEDWVGFLLGLNGQEGSFLMPADTVNTSPRGSFAGSPKVKGAHAAGVRSVALDGFTLSAASVALRGDWVQFGSGSSSRLHKVVKDLSADGAGEGTLELWPPVRAALADNDTFVTASPKGLFMLAPGQAAEWSIDTAQIYGLQFNVIEDLRDL